MDYEIYPEKPVLKKQVVKSNWGLTVFTIVLFIAVFLSLYSNRADFVFFLVAVLLLHELGHFSMMKLFKYENVRMLFIPLMGAFVQGSKERYSQKESVLVVGLGPLPGILLGCLGLFLCSIYKEDWMVLLSFILIFINGVNLLPIDPLDGGQLLKLLVIKQRDLYLMIFALISSLLLIGVGFYLNDWMIIAFGFLMGIRVRAMQRNYELRKELTELEVNYVTTYADLSNRDYHQIKQILIREKPNLANLESVLGDESEAFIADYVNELLIPPINKDLNLFSKIFLLLLWVALFVLPAILLVTIDLNWYFEKF